MIDRFVERLTGEMFEPPRGLGDAQRRERVAMIREAVRDAIPSDIGDEALIDMLDAGRKALMLSAKTQAWPLPSEVHAALVAHAPRQRKHHSGEDEARRAKIADENAAVIAAQSRALAMACRDDAPPPFTIYDAAVVMAVAGDKGRAERINAWWARHGGKAPLTPPALSSRLGIWSEPQGGGVRRMT